MATKNRRILSANEIGDMMRDVELREQINVSRYEQPLSARQVKELQMWKEYLEYDDLLEKRNNLILEIDAKRSVIKNLDTNIKEYKGGLANYRATELNTLYHSLSKVLDTFIGFLSASIIYNGLDVWKTPGLWIYFAAFSIIYTIIGVFEVQRYKQVKRRG